MKKLLVFLLIASLLVLASPVSWTVTAQDATEEPPAEEQVVDEPVPTEEPVPEPTEEPQQPTAEPTQEVVPTAEPTQEVVPTAEPTQEVVPTEEPTQEVVPTEEPTQEVVLTEEPTQEVVPTEEVTEEPTQEVVPTEEGTVEPTVEPTEEATATPVPVTISHIAIRDAADGFGSMVVTHTMNLGEEFTVYAAAYDAEGNYLWDVPANWSLTGSLAQTEAEPAPTEEAVAEPEPEVVATEEPAPKAAAPVLEGEAVVEGEVVVEEAATEEPVLVAEDPTAEPQESQEPDTRTTSFTFTPAAAGEGTIVADDGNGHAYETELITVVELPKEPVISHIVVRDAADGFGNQVMTVTLTVSDTFVLYAAAYDAEGNYIKDVPATWTTTGTLDPLQVTEAISVTFTAVTPNTSGTIVADDGAGRTDATDVIQVVALTVADIDMQSSATAQYTSNIYIANPNSSTTAYSVVFYPPNSGTEVSGATQSGNLNGHGSKSINMSSVSVATGFNGSAVVSADQPVASVVKHVSSTGDVSVYSGFDSGAGGSVLYAPNVHKTYDPAQGWSSRIIVQNIGTSNVNLKVDYYNSATGALSGTETYNGLPSKGSHTFTMSGVSVSNWYGSAVIQAVGGGTIVAVVQALSSATDRAFSIECPASGYPVLYAPTVYRNYVKTTMDYTSYVAVQNPDLSNSIYATVQYYNDAGNPVGNLYAVTIPAGQKKPMGPIQANTPTELLGSMVLKGYTNSSKTTPANILASVTHNQKAGGAKMQMSYLAAGAGNTMISLPYSSWGAKGSTTRWRTFQACQNVGTGNANITFTFYNASGTQAYTTSFTGVAPGTRKFVRPDAFTSSTWEGSAVIQSTNGQPLAVLVNVVRSDDIYLASYNGVGMQ